jgi:hypothetical protein
MPIKQRKREKKLRSIKLEVIKKFTGPAGHAAWHVKTDTHITRGTRLGTCQLCEVLRLHLTSLMR